MTEGMGYIYGLRTRWDSRIRYIGKTNQTVGIRFRAHASSALRGSKYPVHAWMRKHGIVNILPVTLTEAPIENLYLLEQRAIALYRSSGAQLLNLTDGGPGRTGAKLSPESREKIAAKARGRTTPRGRKLNLTEDQRRVVRERNSALFRGEGAHTSKLTASDVLAIRKRAATGERNGDIAVDYSVTPGTVSHIARRHTWKHLPEETE